MNIPRYSSTFLLHATVQDDDKIYVLFSFASMSKLLSFSGFLVEYLFVHVSFSLCGWCPLFALYVFDKTKKNEYSSIYGLKKGAGQWVV